MFEIIWIVAMGAIVTMTVISFIKGSKNAEQATDVYNMLTAKRVKSDLRSESLASGTVLVKKGEGGDPAKAEEPDR